MFLLLACQQSAFIAGNDSGPVSDSTNADSGAADSGDTATNDTGEQTEETPLPLCINEWMPNNESVYKDNTGRYPDWIELYNPTSGLVQLEGWTLSNDRTDESPYAFAAGSTLAPGEFLLLYANDGDGGTSLPFSLSSTAGELVLQSTENQRSIVSWGATEGDFSVARTSDCCAGDGCLDWRFRGTPGISNVEREALVEPVVSLGSSWRYKDDGIEVEGWKQSSFDDSSWRSGPAPLGYGDEGIATTIGYGADANAKHITAWFRAEFSVLGVSTVQSAVLGLRRDDAAVAYLNGQELLRTNLAEGQVSSSTLALTSTAGVNESAVWALPVDPSDLVEGKNVLAIELHQHAGTSSDAVMDAFFDIYR